MISMDKNKTEKTFELSSEIWNLKNLQESTNKSNKTSNEISKEIIEKLSKK